MFDMVIRKLSTVIHDQKNVGLSQYLTIKAAAGFLGVSVSTLRNWDRQGKLRSLRHPMNDYRLYLETDLQQLLTNLAKQKSALGKTKQ
jgi:MerR family transcriptional regulator, copper efflux regulator